MNAMNQPPSRALFVVGTDTGVGKTVVSMLLLRELFARGERPFYAKPMQTGCRDPYDPAEAVGWCFAAPKAPLHAARDEMRGVETEDLVRSLACLRSEHASLVLEGAGGLMVPFTPEALCIDCIRAADARPVLVARAGLGTVNHTLLSVEALVRRGMEPAGIVFVHTKERSASPDLVRDNMEAVAMLSGFPVSGVVPPIENLLHPPDAAFAPLRRMLDVLDGVVVPG